MSQKIVTGAQAKQEFAERLQAAMVKKGWNQSELARQSTKFMPGGKDIGRDKVSNWIRALHMPGPIPLKALADALGVSSEYLIPARPTPAAERATPPLNVEDLGDGSVFLKINQRVQWPVAIKVLGLIKGEAQDGTTQE